MGKRSSPSAVSPAPALPAKRSRQLRRENVEDELVVHILDLGDVQLTNHCGIKNANGRYALVAHR